jgi:hypothetical protein
MFVFGIISIIASGYFAVQYLTVLKESAFQELNFRTKRLNNEINYNYKTDSIIELYIAKKNYSRDFLRNIKKDSVHHHDILSSDSIFYALNSKISDAGNEYLLYFCFTLLSIGFILTILGGCLWFQQTQRFNDMILMLQFEKVKKDIKPNSYKGGRQHFYPLNVFKRRKLD